MRNMSLRKEAIVTLVIRSVKRMATAKVARNKRARTNVLAVLCRNAND